MVLAAVLGLVIFRHALHWGDIPTWIVAATTLLAFIAAAYGGMIAHRLYLIESGRDTEAEVERQARREAERRAQANKVAAWFSRWESLSLSSNGTYTRWGALVRNASDLPILDVRIFFYRVQDPGDGNTWTASLGSAPPRGFRVIPPGATQTMELPESMWPPSGQDVDDQAYVVGVEFTDNANQRWRRDERGKLEPIWVPGPP